MTSSRCSLTVLVTLLLALAMMIGCSSDDLTPASRRTRVGRVDSIQTLNYAAYVRHSMGRKQHSPGKTGYYMVTLDVVPKDSESDALLSTSVDHAAYTRKIQKSAFELHEDISMVYAGEVYPAIGAIMEHDVGLRAGKRFLVWFRISNEEVHADSIIEIRWTDQVFGLGVNRFHVRS